MNARWLVKGVLIAGHGGPDEIADILLSDGVVAAIGSGAE